MPVIPALDLAAPVADLARALVDSPSVSGEEEALADAVQASLAACGHLEVLRDGNAVVARTSLGRAERVIVAGHLDTVPVAGNLPARLEDGVLWGRGTVDMKGGVAVALSLAAALEAPARDVTWVFYDLEEVEESRNGLGRLATAHPDWLAADFAVLGEPTGGVIEGGCNGTVRVEVTVAGVAAHSARAWKGVNAVHGLAPLLAALASYEAATVTVDGLDYREGLQAVGVRGGVAGNVVPDAAVVAINYRFAPDKTIDHAVAHVREVVAASGVGECSLQVVDAAAGARPGLHAPLAASFVKSVAATGVGSPRAKLGWTDVARFGALGIPAVNYGPGDPELAHADDERVETAQIEAVRAGLEGWLTA